MAGLPGKAAIVTGAEVGTVEELAARLRLLEDERAVTDTLIRISDTFPLIELEAWLDCFTEDGAFRMRRGADQPLVYDLAGRDELEPWFLAHAERVPLGKSTQVLGQIRVQVDGDTATTSSLALLIHSIDGSPTLLATVRFYDSLVRCADGRWRVRVREGVGQMRIAGR
jgi:ketosteroid isomerase-like protein